MPGWDPEANDLFLRAREIPAPEDRQRFLDAACAGKPELRARVEGLLRAGAEAGSFLERPAEELGATLAPGSQNERTLVPQEGPGTLIGPYKLLELIGEGGMGTVWMAEQTEPIQRRVALKVVKEGMDSKQVLARFEAERQALALMDHPNIAKVLDAGRMPSGRPYFVMELVKGKPITAYCDEKRLGVRDRLELFGAVCRAVQHAHQKGIIHRDLKPSNVLVAPYDGKPVVKVIDFGVAKATGQRLTDRTLFTGFGALVGTPEYMSPEQAEVNNQDIDTRSDIYSLGVLLYELLTGSTPLTRKRIKEAALLEVLRVIREEEPPRPSTRLSESKDSLPSISAQRQTEPANLTKLVRGELDWIVMKALEKDRTRRYETANGLAMDLERYLADEPVQACPPSASYRFRKFARRQKAALAVAAFAFLALAGTAGTVGWAVRDRAARDQQAAHDREVREAALDSEVEHALDETGPLIEQEKWPEAQAVVERADKLLAAAGRGERPPRLLELQKDLALARRLDEVYRGPRHGGMTVRMAGGGGDGAGGSAPLRQQAEVDFYSGREQDSGFAREFREFGIDVDALAPGEAAARIGRRSIRLALVQAVDEWALLRRRVRGYPDPGWQRLLEISRQADGDPWRNRVRTALLRGDRPALEVLADAAPVGELAPVTVVLLAYALADLGALDRALAVVRAGWHRHPDDFWLNDTLGHFSKDLLRPPRYEDALRYYSMNLALRPQNPGPHRAVAHTLLALGAVGEAKAGFARAFELGPEDAGAHFEFGNALCAKGQLDEAIAEYRAAIRFNNDHREAHNNLGGALYRKGQLDAAIAEYREAIRLDKDYRNAHSNLGVALHLKGRLDEAIAEYRAAIRLNKDEPQAHHNLGLALQAKGQVDDAVAEFREAVRLNKDYPEAHMSLGYALRAKGQLDEAIAEYRAAIRLNKDYREAYNNLGGALNDKGQVDEAIAEFRAAIRLDKDYCNAHMNLGLSLYKKGRLEDAIAEFREALRIDKNRVDARNSLGLVLRDKADGMRREGDLRGALAVVAEAHAVRPDAAEFTNYLAWMLVVCPDPKVRDVKQALELAKKAVAATPDDWCFLRTLGVSQHLTGDDQAAIKALNRSLELHQGGEAIDHFPLAAAHQKLGHKQEARKWYDKGVTAANEFPYAAELAVLRADAEAALGIAIPSAEKTSPGKKE